VIGADVVVANIVAVIDGRGRKCAEILKKDKPYRYRPFTRSGTAVLLLQCFRVNPSTRLAC
jgi:hypothetical protein